MFDRTKLTVDPYPNYSDDWGSKEDFIKTRIEYTYDVLKNEFENENDFMDFLKKFKKANELALFFNTMIFYGVGKTHNQDPNARLMYLVSTIEKIQSDESYKSIERWLLSKDQKTIIEEYLLVSNYNTYKTNFEIVKELYSKKYGAYKKFKEYLIKNLSIEQKIQLIQSFRTKYKEKLLMPFCFDNCKPLSDVNLKSGNCNDYICHLETNEVILNESINKIAKVIYNFRSNVVHDASFAPLSLDADSVYGTYNGELILIKINLLSIEKIFENSLVSCYKTKFQKRIQTIKK